MNVSQVSKLCRKIIIRIYVQYSLCDSCEKGWFTLRNQFGLISSPPAPTDFFCYIYISLHEHTLYMYASVHFQICYYWCWYAVAMICMLINTVTVHKHRDVGMFVINCLVFSNIPHRLIVPTDDVSLGSLDTLQWSVHLWNTQCNLAKIYNLTL